MLHFFLDGVFVFSICIWFIHPFVMIQNSKNKNTLCFIFFYFSSKLLINIEYIVKTAFSILLRRMILKNLSFSIHFRSALHKAKHHTFNSKAVSIREGFVHNTFSFNTHTRRLCFSILFEIIGLNMKIRAEPMSLWS